MPKCVEEFAISRHIDSHSHVDFHNHCIMDYEGTEFLIQYLAVYLMLRHSLNAESDSYHPATFGVRSAT